MFGNYSATSRFQCASEKRRFDELRRHDFCSQTKELPMMKRMKRRRFLESAAIAGLLAPVASYWCDLPEARAASSRKNLILIFIPNGKAESNPFVVREGSSWSFAQGFRPYEPFKSDAIAFERYGYESIITAKYRGDHAGHLGGSAGMFTGEIPYARAGVGEGLMAPSIDQIVAWDWLRQGTIRDPLRSSLGIRMFGASFRIPAVFGQVPAGYTLGATYDRPMTSVTQHTSPMEGFRQMFGDLAGMTGTTMDALWARGGSVLDLPAQELATLHDQLPAEGRIVLDEHLSSLRDLEASLLIEESERIVPPDPPEAIDATRPENYVSVFSQWVEIIDLALRLDRTRIVTIQFGGVACRFSIPELGLGYTGSAEDPSNSGSDMHSYSHWQASELPLFMNWFAERNAQLLGRLKGGASRTNILADSAVMIGTEGGHVHRPLDTPVLLFGGAGGALRTQQLLTYANDAAHLHTGTLLSVCHAMGVTDLTQVGNPDPAFQRGVVPDLLMSS
jgi:hypothetical protein